MCGIIAYTGPLNAKDIVLTGLEQLEYRGYDSAGLAIVNDDYDIQVCKSIGKVEALKAKTLALSNDAHTGMGHTRWATHGGVSTTNAHPHSAGKVTLIHNGIIENYQELINEYNLQTKLKSQTDSEVVALVLNELYNGDPIKSIYELVSKLIGSYSFCIIFEDKPHNIFCIRRVSPLVCAYSSSGALAASDLTALIPYTKEYFIAPEDTIICLDAYSIHVYDKEGQDLKVESLKVHWDVDSAMKNGFEHFMLKEIFEQAEVFKNTILPRINKGLPDFTDDNIDDTIFKNCNKIHIIACGSAVHTGMAIKNMIQEIVKIPCLVSIASEFYNENPIMDNKTLVLIISQSGETIDTLTALRLAKNKGAKTLAIVNVKGATIARESDYVLYTHAGPEIAVASTKAYMVQLAALYLILAKLAMEKGVLKKNELIAFTNNLIEVNSYLEESLKLKDSAKDIAKYIINFNDVFFLGRGLDYALALEGALKLKEISYIHAEAYAAGELKHGPIALIENGIPVIAIITQKDLLSKSVSNLREVKARGAYVILITNLEIDDINVYDKKINISKCNDKFSIFGSAVILQFISYYASLYKGIDVDKPRNLAKSVTVE